MQVSLQYAKEHYADIVSAVVRGEEVEIAEPEQPVLKLTLVRSDSIAVQPVKRVARRGLAGAWEGTVILPTAEDWKALDKEIEDEMLNGPVFPVGHE